MRSLLYSLLLLALLFVSSVRAQEPATDQTSTQDDDDVLRINVNLVQTDVMIFDKEGRFVDNLQGEQFDLRLDGRPQSISSIERVTSGSSREEARLSAARVGGGGGKTLQNGASNADEATGRGRAIFFFVDDLHLSPDSISRTRKLLYKFLEETLGENDQAVIVSPSGRIGFLQQLTDDKTVLRAAIMRIGYRPSGLRLQDTQRPPISEFEALAIDRNDTDALSYFTEQTIRENPGMQPEIARETVKQRARAILNQAALLTGNTLSSLQRVVRTSSQWTGRKLVFFISDGLFLDAHTSDALQRLENITDAAARSGVVIYTLDARGLTSGLPDASSNVPADPTGRLSRVDSGELSASQDLMHLLAENTGGRALLNTNALDQALTRALDETSVYYLIAWQPDRVEESANKFRRITLSVKNHPELSVQVRRGFFNANTKLLVSKANDQKTPAPAIGATIASSPAPTPVDELRTALGSLYPRTALPTHLSLTHLNTEKEGSVLTASIQLDAEKSKATTGSAISAPPSGQVLCAVFNSEGKAVASTIQQLNFSPLSTSQQEFQRASLNLRFKLAPGLYQVRIAAHDDQSGRLGSATAWAEIPNIARGVFALGSLLAVERLEVAAGETGAGAPPVMPREIIRLNADHVFERASYLRFVTYIYNATSRKGAPPEVQLEVKVLRDRKTIVSLPFKSIEVKGETDLTRIPYVGQVRLAGMTPGRYVLQITAVDSATKKTVTQEFKFAVR